jgi:hypothetical protein
METTGSTRKADKKNAVGTTAPVAIRTHRTGDDRKELEADQTEQASRKANTGLPAERKVSADRMVNTGLPAQRSLSVDRMVNTVSVADKTDWDSVR